MSRVASFWNLAQVTSLKTAGSNQTVSAPCSAVMSNSKMPRTGDASQVPWTIKDFDNCVELVLRARKRQAFDDVMARVRRIEDGIFTELAAVGLTDGDYVKCDEISGQQAMTDAAKHPHGAVEPSFDDDDESWQGYVMAAPATPPMSSDQHGPPKSSLLPQGVHSLQEWGTFKVAFGKFKGKKTYYQIYAEDHSEMIEYRKYLNSRRESGSPLLRDLAEYIHAMTGSAMNDQLPRIPGTNVVRSK